MQITRKKSSTNIQCDIYHGFMAPLFHTCGTQENSEEDKSIASQKKTESTLLDSSNKNQEQNIY